MNIFDFKCKYCGGELELVEGMKSVGRCIYCNSKQTLPKLESEKRADLFKRANHLRRNNEFDKAEALYEQLLNEDLTDPEAYWSLALCKYGIEYVEDSRTKSRIPTINRMQYTSILADENYKSAIANATPEQKEIYEAEAVTINKIQKGILEIANKEEPFDVFICYKETDEKGKRSKESYLAHDLYHELTRHGYKVFFARVTLQEKLGVAYEPYIFSALNSSKVMIVLGTQKEHFEAVWVRNEWSRFLGMIKNGEKKVLIPAYRDMDAYDLPVEFSHLQALDMSRFGFLDALIDNINIILKSSAKTEDKVNKASAPESKSEITSKPEKKKTKFIPLICVLLALAIGVGVLLGSGILNGSYNYDDNDETVIKDTTQETTTAEQISDELTETEFEIETDTEAAIETMTEIATETITTAEVTIATTVKETTAEETTVAATTEAKTTVEVTTEERTTVEATTEAKTTAEVTTEERTTVEETTVKVTPVVEGDWDVMLSATAEEGGINTPPLAGYYYDSKGLHTISPDYTNYSPKFTVLSKEKINVRNFSMTVVVHDYNTSGDNWLSFTIWSECNGFAQGYTGGDKGDGWTSIIRSGKDGNVNRLESWDQTKGGRTGKQSFINIDGTQMNPIVFKPIVDAKTGDFTITFEIKNGVVSVNGSVVGAGTDSCIADRFTDGLAYVGVTLNNSDTSGGYSPTISIIDVNGAIPEGGDRRNPNTLGNMSNSNTVSKNPPAIWFDGTLEETNDELPTGSNCHIDYADDNESIKVTAGAKAFYVNFNVPNDISYEASDFTYIAFIFKNFCTCDIEEYEDLNDACTGEEVGSIWYCAGEVTSYRNDCANPIPMYYNVTPKDDYGNYLYDDMYTVGVIVINNKLWKGRINSIRLEVGFYNNYNDYDRNTFEIMGAGIFKDGADMIGFIDEFRDLGLYTEYLTMDYNPACVHFDWDDNGLCDFCFESMN